MHKSQDIHLRETEMLSGSALTYKQERSASDLCKWYHTKNPNLLKLWVLMSSLQKCRVCRDLETVFPTQATSCTGQRASCRVSRSASVERRGFQSSPSKPGGDASTFTLDVCTADTGGLGQHMLRGDALQFVKPHEQAVAEWAKQRLKSVSALPALALLCWIPHIAA